LLAAVPAAAQDRQEPDRSDPAIIERELEPADTPRRPRQQPRIDVQGPAAGRVAAQGQEIIAGAIRVQGASRLPAAAFAPAIEPYLGRPLAQRDLVALATAVANVARRAGYGLATAWVPAQNLGDGMLVVEIEEGRIDAVRATGPGAALVEQRLAPVIGGGPVRTADLERELLLVGDQGGLWVGDARMVRENGRNILTVASRQQRVEGRVAVDNWGSATIGPVRAWGEVDFHALAVPGDTLSIGIATTPLNPQEFHLLEGRYRLPVGGRGTTMAVGGYFGLTDAEPDLRTRGFRGDSWQVELEVTHPLERSRARSLWLTGRLELRDSELERGTAQVRDDRIASATLGVHGFDRFAGGKLRIRAGVVQGLDLLGATRLGDPLASRRDAGGVFTKFEGWAEYTRPLGNRFSARAALRTQLADGPLLSSEEMGLGGAQFLRAFDYREFSGDRGIAGSIELRFDLKNVVQYVEKVQFYGYADAGRVTNTGSGFGGGSLASAGAGIRLDLAKRWDLGLEVGVPLTRGGDDRNPDPRFSFTLRTRF
jgi:hemolysin activation/secretion protein